MRCSKRLSTAIHPLTCSLRTSSSNGGNNSQLIAVLQRCLFPIHKANVLIIEVEVDELPNAAPIINQALPETRKMLFQIIENVCDRGPVRWYFTLIFGELLQRRRNAYDNSHRNLSFHTYDSA